MSQLVAVGNRAFVTALAGIGAEPVRCESPEEFAAILKGLATQKDVRLVFASDPHTQAATEAVAAFRKRSSAGLLSLPLVPSDAHPDLEDVRHLVEQATGASLI